MLINTTACAPITAKGMGETMSKNSICRPNRFMTHAIMHHLTGGVRTCRARRAPALALTLNRRR